MTRFGSEATIYTDGDNISEITENIKDYKVFSTFKRTTVRVKVGNKKDETTQYLIFSDLIEEKRKAGTLILRDGDPTTKPCFIIEYPRTDIDGHYFIIRSFTEVV